MDTVEAPAGNKALSEGVAHVGSLFAGTIDDPHALYKRYRAESPVLDADVCAELGAVSFAGHGERPVYTLFKHADVMRVLRDSKTFTSGILMETGLGSFLDGLMITGQDGDEHRQLRGLLAPAFAPAVMEDWCKTYMRPLIKKRFVDPILASGKAELIAAMGVMFPIHVVYSVLGFQDDPAAVEDFAAKALLVLGGMANDPAAKQAAFQAFQDLYEPTRIAVEKRRAEGGQGSDLMSRLIHAEFEGRRLDDHQITNFVRMILPAASETTSRSFAILLQLMLTRPELMAQLKADRSKLRAALDESIRYDPVATFKVREAQSEVTLSGVTIPKGAIVQSCVSSANRDEAVFENPDVYDIERKQMPSFGFGFGAHLCLGMWLAKAEIEEAIDLILDHMPNLRLDPDYPVPEIRGVHLRGPDALHVVWDN